MTIKSKKREQFIVIFHEFLRKSIKKVFSVSKYSNYDMNSQLLKHWCQIIFRKNEYLMYF